MSGIFRMTDTTHLGRAGWSFFLLFTSAAMTTTEATPNIIIMQGDDLDFLEHWNAVPAHVNNNRQITRPTRNQIPNINRLRLNGLEMQQAHTASPMCGTSRYSTITGRYPSRSSFGRHWDVINGNDIRNVAIMMSRMMDMPTNRVQDTKDCSKNNIAVAFQENGYATGIVGKWHLFDDKNPQWNYNTMQSEINQCGFDFAEALYPHNFGEEWASRIGHDLEHNMEWVASEGIRFMEQNLKTGQPFFLYVNPTIPHPTSYVTEALKSGSCREVTSGVLNSRPPIPYGAPPEYNNDNNCKAYRKTVLDRTNGNSAQGMVWVDDAVGWMIATLEEYNQLDNTIFLFQQDHGMEIKGGIYEQSTRIAQFIHYPNLIPKGSQFDGLVSTVDIGPTMMDYAGISPPYSMDGKSWKNAIGKANQLSAWKERCIFAENGYERSVKCGCDVLWKLDQRNRNEFWYTRDKASQNGLKLSNGDYQMFNICNQQGNWIDSPGTTAQKNGATLLGSAKVPVLRDILECHLDRTDPYARPNYQTCDPNDGGGGGGGPVDTDPPTDAPTRSPSPPSSGTDLICLNQMAGTWSEHRSVALRYGGDLLSIPNRKTRNRARKLARRKGTPGSWIGLTDEGQEGQFVWSDGSQSTYTDFYPEAENRANWDCVHLRPNRAWRWNYNRCSVQNLKGLYRIPSTDFCDAKTSDFTDGLVCLQDATGRPYSEACGGGRRELGDGRHSEDDLGWGGFEIEEQQEEPEKQYLRNVGGVNGTQSQAWL